MESITQFITQELKLKVNETKSAVARPQERKFLGFSFSAGPEVKRVIAPKALNRFKQRIREITRRAKGVSMETTMEELAPYMRGWRSYFGFCETPDVLVYLTRWVRLRLRAALWRQWKTPRRRRAALLELGVRPRLAANTAGSGHGPWYLARAQALAFGPSNAYFKSLGLPSFRLSVPSGSLSGADWLLCQPARLGHGSGLRARRRFGLEPAHHHRLPFLSRHPGNAGTEHPQPLPRDRGRNPVRPMPRRVHGPLGSSKPPETPCPPSRFDLRAMPFSGRGTPGSARKEGGGLRPRQRLGGFHRGLHQWQKRGCSQRTRRRSSPQSLQTGIGRQAMVRNLPQSASTDQQLCRSLP